MSWGKAIPLVFIFFAGFIGTMVFRMSRQRIDLVRDDYYQDEITYQQHIDRVANARQNQPTAMTYESDKQVIAITLPEALRRGAIHFYRPADRQQDFDVKIPADHTRRQVVSTAHLARGYWRVQFTWSDGRLDYYSEQDVFL